MHLINRAAVYAAMILPMMAFSSPAAAPPDVAKRVTASIAKAAPHLPKPVSINRTPIAGLFEVAFPGFIRYSDASGRYLVEGSVIDLATQSNVTDARVAEISKIEWSRLPIQLAIKTRVNGAGQRKLFVFADPQCGYCRRAEQTFASMKNLTVYTVLLPILGPKSVELSKAVACAADPGAAWNRLMVDGVAPEAAGQSCDADFGPAQLYAKQHGINGTPAIYLVDGTRLPGAVPVEQIEAALAAASKR